MKDPYTVLGVSPSAEQKAVKAAHRKLVRQYHRDASDRLEGSDEKMIEINLAYEILGDAKKRTAYDQGLRATSSQKPFTASARKEPPAASQAWAKAEPRQKERSADAMWILDVTLEKEPGRLTPQDYVTLHKAYLFRIHDAAEKADILSKLADMAGKDKKIAPHLIFLAVEGIHRMSDDKLFKALVRLSPESFDHRHIDHMGRVLGVRTEEKTGKIRLLENMVSLLRANENLAAYMIAPAVKGVTLYSDRRLFDTLVREAPAAFTRRDIVDLQYTIAEKGTLPRDRILLNRGIEDLYAARPALRESGMRGEAKGFTP